MLRQKSRLVISSLLHSDNGVEQLSANTFGITARGVKLVIESIQPTDLKSEISDNVVTAPGPPGAVDKGERQQRGRRLALSTPNPVTNLRLQMRLRVENAKQPTTQAVPNP